ncbi:unnamed protein product, partial [Polarella glacialis]
MQGDFPTNGLPRVAGITNGFYMETCLVQNGAQSLDAVVWDRRWFYKALFDILAERQGRFCQQGPASPEDESPTANTSQRLVGAAWFLCLLCAAAFVGLTVGTCASAELSLAGVCTRASNFDHEEPTKGPWPACESGKLAGVRVGEASHPGPSSLHQDEQTLGQARRSPRSTPRARRPARTRQGDDEQEDLVRRTVDFNLEETPATMLVDTITGNPGPAAVSSGSQLSALAHPAASSNATAATAAAEQAGQPQAPAATTGVAQPVLPAPPAPHPEGRPARWSCPAPNCPQANNSRCAGWAALQSMVPHLNNHFAETLQGEVPTEWLQRHNKARCRVCGLCVAASRGVHPTCRPEERRQVRSELANAGQNLGAGPGQASFGNLPSLEQVQSQHARTLKHVPKAARGLWAQALVRCLATVAVYNTIEAWTELEMLPKLTLMPPPRGGRQHVRAAASFTADRLSRWLEGDRQGLWEDVLATPTSPGQKGSSDASRLRRADALAREGFDRKACAALVSGGVCAETAATTRLLRLLHPLSPVPTCPPLDSLPLAAVIGQEVVSKVLHSFPQDSAPGPSSLRVQHLLEGLTPAHRAAVLEQLTAVVQLLVRGEAPEAVAPTLAGVNGKKLDLSTFYLDD